MWPLLLSWAACLSSICYILVNEVSSNPAATQSRLVTWYDLIGISVSLCCLLGYTSTCTDRVNVEGVGANEGDCILQIVVLDPVLEVLIGNHSQSQGTHGVLAQIGQLYLQAHSVTHYTVSNDIAVTWLPVHQDIWKQKRRQETRGISRTRGGCEGSFVKCVEQKWNKMFQT